MTEIFLSLCVFIFMLQCAKISMSRRLVYSFLLSKRNVRKAREIHREQSVRQRLTLSYIREHAIYPREFSHFHRFYIVSLLLLPFPFVLSIPVYIFFAQTAIVLAIILAVIEVILLFYLRAQFHLSSPMISRFDKRYGELNKRRGRKTK